MQQRTLLLFSLAAVIALAPGAPAETPPILVPPVVPPPPPITTDGVSPDKPRLFDFSGESVGAVLRKLGRAAHMSIVVDDSVEGEVNMRIEGQTPKEALMIILESKDLVYKRGTQGLYFIRPRNPPIRVTDADKAAAGKSLSSHGEPTKEDVNSFFTPALTGFADAMLDYEARPEVARKRARAKKALYDALLSQGFTKDEAFRLIRTNRELTAPFSGE